MPIAQDEANFTKVCRRVETVSYTHLDVYKRQTTVNIGLFGEFASFPVTLTAKASGTSEVYWK